VNKEGSRLDRFQKEIGEYYYITENAEEKER
jgi:translation initiation factor RLI1